MFITRKHLSRRTVLRGLGATIALPLLDGMVPALTAQRLFEDPKNAVAEMMHDVRARDAVDDNGELVAAQPGDQIRGPH